MSEKQWVKIGDELYNADHIVSVDLAATFSVETDKTDRLNEPIREKVTGVIVTLSAAFPGEDPYLRFRDGTPEAEQVRANFAPKGGA